MNDIILLVLILAVTVINPVQSHRHTTHSQHIHLETAQNKPPRHHHESQRTTDAPSDQLELLYHNPRHTLRPATELPVYGLCYHSPLAHDSYCPSMHQTYVELYELRKYTQRIRLYSMQQCNIIDILHAAEHLNMTVILTMYLTTHNQWNTNTADVSFGMEKSVLLRLLDTEHSLIKNTVHSILVGSECMLRNELTATQLTHYVIDIQTTLWYKHFPWIEVSSADAYSAMVDPNRHDIKQLLNTVDYIAVHIYPFYEQIDINDAIDHIDKSLHKIHKLMNNDRHRIILTETGWPSDGHHNGDSIPSPDNLYQYYNEFICYARKHNLEYYFFEAYDEAWKATDPNDKYNSESHFGLLNEGDHQFKYPFDTLDVRC